MDASIADNTAYAMKSRLLDREQVPLEKICGFTWYLLLGDLIQSHDRVLERVPTVFVPLADLMTGNDTKRIRIQVPRAMTTFDKGLGPVTRVLPIHLNHERCGAPLSKGNPGVWSGNTEYFLLLLQPAEKVLAWACWAVSYNLQDLGDKADVPYKRTVVSSDVGYMDKPAILRLLNDKNKGLGFTILDSLYLALYDFEAEMRRLSELKNTVEQIKYRIRT